MGLRIGQFVTQCHVPPRYRNKADVVDRLARGRLASDLGSHLGPSLSRQPAIVRIRRLALRVVVPGSEFNEESLSRAWTQAFSHALFTALAYPSGAGPVEVFRADSLAAFLAATIRDALDGVALDQWQYAEFADILRLGRTPAALRLLCDWPQETLAVLVELVRTATLDRLLARFDDLALEQIFSTLAPHGTAELKPVSVADLFTVARLVLAHVPTKISALPTRQFALKLFVQSRLLGEAARSPRAIFHSLLALAFLLNNRLFFRNSIHRQPLTAQFPTPVADLIEMLGTQTPSAIEPSGISALHDLLTEMRSELKIPTPAAAPHDARWIRSSFCGLFFLAGILDRLGWASRWRRIPRFQVGGISPLLAGLALAIVDTFEDRPRSLDPGIALFAGYEGDPDLDHLHAVLQDYPRDARLEVLRAALPDHQIETGADSWSDLFALLAKHLLELFRSKLRGFRQATQSGMVRIFIAKSGRILVAPQRLVVVPEPSAFWVALHIADLDAPVHSLSWLGGLRLEFELGEL